MISYYMTILRYDFILYDYITMTPYYKTILLYDYMTADFRQHVMLSYNHQAKTEVLKMNDRLRQLGYKVWIDMEQITAGKLCLSSLLRGSYAHTDFALRFDDAW